MAEALSVPAPFSRTEFGPALFAGVACLADILLLRGWLLGWFDMAEAIGLHVCLALALGALATGARRRFSQAVLVRVILLILFGPLGGPALMILTPGKIPARSRTPAAEAAKASHRSRADDLYDQIRQGRRHHLPTRPFPGFLKTFGTGALHQQQEAIAAISRSYHPDMRSALSAALASPIPALRVQAAAVYAKLRGSYEVRAKELLALDVAGDPSAGRHLADECLAVAASGFVDARTGARLRELSARLALPAPSSAPPSALSSAPPLTPPAHHPRPPHQRAALTPLPRLKRHACGGLG